MNRPSFATAAMRVALARYVGSLVMLFVVCGVAVRAAEPPRIDSIDALWADFDPHELPLEVEVVKEWDEDDLHLQTIYFTGEIFEREKTRIFGYLGRAKEITGKTPGILHIHGGGQTANLDWARYWARRGYVGLSFDFCGNTNLPTLGPEYRRERYTLWGKVPANMMEIGGGRTMLPDPRRNPWFHWTMAARRGLTLLEAQEGIDKEKLGIFGISVGGTLTWIVAGVDARVQAAVPIYGNGWESYSEYPPDMAATVNEETRLWRLLIAPETHARRIRCPLLFVDATNDFHGKMDLGYRTLDLTGAPIKRQVFTPNFDHHIEPAEARSLALWMDHHLRGPGNAWPETATLKIARGSDGVPQVLVTPRAEDDVTRVDVYYSLNNDWPMARFWRTAATERQGEQYVAQAPVLATSDVITAFANVSYSSGVRQSTRLVRQPLAEISEVRTTLAPQTLIDSMDTATDWTWVPAYTDPNQGETAFFEPWQGADGERGFTLDGKMFPHDREMNYYFGTRKPADPQWRGQGDGPLSIDYLAAHRPTKLTVRLKRRLPPDPGQEYFAEVLPGDDAENTTKSDAAWQTLRLQKSQFKSAQGVVLPDWEHVEYFILQGVNAAAQPPVFKRLRWSE